MKFPILLAFAASLALAGGSNFDERGRSEFAAGQFRSAKASFEKAVRSTAANPEEQAISLTNLAQTLLALGELKAARDAVTRASVVLPESAQVWYLLGQVLVRQGDSDGGIKAIRQAMRLAAAEPNVVASCQSDLATILVATGRMKEAISLIEQAVTAAQPGQARARMIANLGFLRWKSGKKAEATATIRQALTEMEASVGPEHPDVARILEEYAEALAKIGHKPEARQAADRAREMRLTFGWQANTTSAVADWRDLR